MQLKGINPFEQHVEKAVIGIVVALALGVLAWQFIGPTNTVTVGKQTVEVHRGYDVVKVEAEDLLRKLRQTEGIEFPEVGEFDMLARLEQRMGGPIIPTRALAWAGDVAVTLERDSRDPRSELRVVAFEPPAPSTPKAAVYLGTISPLEVAEEPALARFLPKQMPFDKAGVSVEATFDGKALQSLLAGDPDGDTAVLSEYPRHWWENKMQILAVELEREELQPDGAWSDLRALGPVPGRFDLRERINAAADSVSGMGEVIQAATEHAAAVRRPEYLSMVMGEPWVPPSRVVTRSGGQDRARIEREKQNLDRARRDIERLEEDLAKVEGDDARARQRRQGIEAQIAQARQRADRARDALREEGEPIPGEERGAEFAAPQQQAEPPLLENPAVQVWAHDITAERGKTYRYRVVLLLPNPLHGQAAALPQDLEPLTTSAVVRSAPSPWTTPVHVDPETFLFIISAQDLPAGGPIAGGPRATAEIFTFYWGYWRKGSVSLRPGDPLAGVVRAPDYGVMMPELLGEPGADGQAAVPVDPPAEPVYTELRVARDGYLLDVAAVPVARQQLGGGTGVQFQAVLRDSGQVIVVRNPDVDRGSEAYQRVLRSAQQGEQRVRPVVTEPPRGPRGPVTPDQPTRSPKGPGGGGG